MSLFDRVQTLDEMQLPPGFKTWKDYLSSPQAKKGKHKKAKAKYKPSPPAKRKPSPLKHLSKHYSKDRLPKDVFSELKKWAGTRTITPANFVKRIANTMRKGGLRATRRYIRKNRANREKVVTLGLKAIGTPPSSSAGKTKGLIGLFDKLVQADPHAGDDWGMPSTMGGGWGKSSKPKWKPKPKPPMSPEQQKLADMVSALKKKHSKIKRQAAGGVVFKTFEGPDIWELPVLVTKTSAKYGAPHWVFPKGGLDAGESLKQGAVREVYEEGGVKSKVAARATHVTKSTFGDRGKYDHQLILGLLKKANPKEAKFLDDHLEDIKFKTSWTYENHSHYFVMRWTSGSPSTGADPGHEEMSAAEWTTLKAASKMGFRMGDIIKTLFPTIMNLWKPTGGATKKGVSLSSLRSPKPREPKPKDNYTPATQKGSHGPKKPAQPSFAKPYKATGYGYY